MPKKLKAKASEKYFKPRDRFYEFLEQHEALSHERKKSERKGAVFMAFFFCALITLAFVTHENSEYNLVSKIFGP